MPDTSQRTLSDNEKIYRKYRNPEREYFHVMLECTNSIDTLAVEDAFNKLRQLVPEISYGIRSNRFIHMKRRHTIRVIRVPGFNGYNLDTLDFMQELGSGLPIEIRHIQSLKGDWLIFTVSHSLTDGQGLLLILNMLFDVLNGNGVVRPNSHENDTQFLLRVGHTKGYPKLSYNNILTRRSFDRRNKEYIRRVTLKGVISFPLSKIIEVLNRYYDNESLTYLIPSDLRRYDRSTTNIGNLTAPLYLRCAKTDTWHQITTKLHAQLKREENLNASVVTYPRIANLNNLLFNVLISTSRSVQLCTRRFLTAGSITNIGTLNLNIYQSSALRVKSIFFVPLFQPLLPLSVSIVETRDQTDVIFVSNYQVIDHKTMNSIITDVRALM